MFTRIVSIIFYGIIEAIDKWLTKKKLEQLESQIAATNATISSMQEASKTEDEIKKVQEELNAKLNELNSYKSKLEFLNNYNKNAR